MNNQTINKSEVVKKTKIETTYEYVPILGEILGYWRKDSEHMLGQEIILHLNHPLREYDRIYINGEEVFVQKDGTLEKIDNSPKLK